MRIKFPVLRIHVWGGLGSQLFGVSLAHSLKLRFPKRSLLVVLHSSGVTRREPEVMQLFPELNFVNVDDFAGRASHDSGSQRRSFNFLCRQIVRDILLFSGFLAEENSNDRHSARIWTLAIRGHYFHRDVSPDFLNLLSNRLDSFVKRNFEEIQNEITLHYRLGDLIKLSNKNFVDPERICSTLVRLQESNNVSVFSDTPDFAISLLGRGDSGKSLRQLNLSTVETIYFASKGAAFVGTSSKISYWIILLRVTKSETSINYLPIEDEPAITFLKGVPSGVCFY